MVNCKDDSKIYEDNINTIAAVSKIQNLEVFHSNAYVINENSIRNNEEINCNLYFSTEDEIIHNQIKKNIERKELKQKKKLELAKKQQLNDQSDEFDDKNNKKV